MKKSVDKVEKVIIVGGGLAGLGCAKRLHENGYGFKIITENIGGRVKTSPDGEVNYGAYYARDDYTTLWPYLKIVRKFHFRDIHFHKNGEHYHYFSLRIIKHIPALIRLFIDLYKFKRHLKKFKKKSFDHSRKELIEANPLFKKYYHEKAGDYIKRRGLEALNKEYLEQFLWASFFYDPNEVPTTLYIGSLLPLIMPFYSFKVHFYGIIDGFQHDIIKDSVINVIRKKEYFELKTKIGKTYRCKRLVLATPMNITNKLVKPQKIKGGINVSYYHLNGEIRKEYDVKWYNFFSLKEAAAISKEEDGTFLYFYNGKDNINKYFKKWKLITHDTWKPALFFLGDEYVDMNPEENLFLANDHNVPSIEGAFINGHYTAKLVMDSFKK